MSNVIKRRKMLPLPKHGVSPISRKDVPVDLETRYVNQGVKSLVTRLHGVDGVGYGVSPISPLDVPIDLQERFINTGLFVPKSSGGLPQAQSSDDVIKNILRDVHSLAGTITLSSGLLGRVVTLTGVPQLIVNAQYDRGYLLLNPAKSTGLTSTGTLFSSQTVIGAGANTTSISIGAGNYKTARFWVEATFVAGAGPVPFTLQTKNPVTGTYIDSQVVFNLTATGNAYANVGGLGIDTDFVMTVVVPVGTTITFSVGYCLKDGLAGTSSGASQTIFIGGAGVNPISGYPILDGQEKSFWLLQNVNLYGVTSGSSLNLNIFEL